MMAPYNESWKNKAWLAWFVLQIPLILLIDMLEFLYPKWVYEPAGAPLQPACAVKQCWMGLFLLLVFAFLLPTSLYGIYHLGLKRRGTSGADELLFLVYALEVAFTTLVSIFDSFYWDSAVYSAELKRTFLVQLYGPWSTIGAIDMATRILARIKAADAVMDARKSQ